MNVAQAHNKQVQRTWMEWTIAEAVRGHFSNAGTEATLWTVVLAL